MKKTLFILSLMFGFTAIGQEKLPKWGEDSTKCHENLYIYYELARNKAYAEAYDAWRYVFDNCPGSSKNNFILGDNIVEFKIKEATDEAVKMEFSQLLLNLYDTRLLYFPEKESYVMGIKALATVKYFPDSNKTAYETFKKALEVGDQKQSAAFYNGYFISAARLFNAKVFEIGDVFQAYNVVIEGIEFNTDDLNREITGYQEKQEAGTLEQKEEDALAKAERELERYDDVASNINKILAPIATCEKLQIIYNEETFEANKTDAVWLNRAAVMLIKERTDDEGNETNCTDNPIFFKVAEALYQLNPSAKSARAMAGLSIKDKNYTKAADFLQEAIDGEVDPKKKANDLVKLAQIQLNLGRLSSAKSSALKAASMRKNWGKPYVILATVYASAYGQCTGANVFENKAVYWAAIDKLKYARTIDPSVTGQANSRIAAYKKQLPDKGTIFQLGKKEGDKFTIGCFINETITVDYSI